MHTDNQQCDIDTTNYNFPRKFIRQRKEIKKKERKKEKRTSTNVVSATRRKSLRKIVTEA